MNIWRTYFSPPYQDVLRRIKSFTFMSWLILISLILWALLLYWGVFIPQYNMVISKFSAEAEFFVHFLIMIPTLKIYRRATPQDRKILLWFLVTNLGLFINDFTFYIMVYLQNTLLTNTAFMVFIVDFVPLLIWIVAGLIFLAQMLLQGILQSKNFIKLLVFFTAINLIIIYLFLSSIDYAFPIFTWQSMSQIILVCMQLLIFDGIILCLIYCESKGLFYFLVGLTILISGNLFVVYSVSSQTSNLLVYGELLWFLGLLFMMFGCWMIYVARVYRVKDWFRRSDSIKSRLVFWSFGTSITSFLLFFMMAYFFAIIDKKVLSGLPFFIMIYSIIVIAFAVFMGKTFEAPFKKIECNIRALMFDDDKAKVNTTFSTEEFRFLQNFILEAYEHKEGKDRVKKHLGEITAQVAHDIRSPTAALLVLSQTCTDIPEEDRIALREAAHTIQDIANNVLNQYSLGDEQSVVAPHKEQDLLMSGLMLEILSEKRLQYKGVPIKFDYDFDAKASFAFAKGDQTRFKRMLSNLVNNAVDACIDEAGQIVLSLQASADEVILGVRDNGKGMSSKVIDKIMQAEVVTTGKTKGHGLGFAQVRQTLGEYQGRLEIDSNPGRGTEVRLVFPKLPTPRWVAAQMLLKPHAVVIVLDDDKSIHTAWDHRLHEVITEGNIKVLHFNEGISVIESVAKMSASDQEQLFLLTDYELLRQPVNGLDVLEATGIQHSILVTSHYANPEIIERSALLGAKILPKLLVAQLPILLKGETHDELGAFDSVDIVIVDDKLAIMKIIVNYYLKGKKVKLYDNPYTFLDDRHHYDKNIPICLDDDFNTPELHGRALAEKLHQEGFTRLYLISGTKFNELPDYLTVLDKNKIKEIFNTTV